MGILVSDNYGVYQKWVDSRQKSGLLGPISSGLAEHPNTEIA